MFEHHCQVLVAHKLVVVHQVEGVLVVCVGLVALVQLLEREWRLAKRFSGIDHVAQIANRVQRNCMLNARVKFVILIFTVQYVWNADGQANGENRVVGAKAHSLEFAHYKFLVVGEPEVDRHFGSPKTRNINGEQSALTCASYLFLFCSRMGIHVCFLHGFLCDMGVNLSGINALVTE